MDEAERPPIPRDSPRRHTPARERLADAVRAVIDHLVGADAPDDVFDDAAARIEEVAARLEGFPAIGNKPVGMPGFDDLQAVFWRDPTIGRANPIAPPVEITVDGTTVHGRARFHHGYEGPPGYVHGAVIAACFDQVLGLANLAAGNAGMTGTLTIRYRRPTPLGVDVLFEARTEGTEGRKIFTAGTARVADEITAEAEGVFVNLSAERAHGYFLKHREA